MAYCKHFYFINILSFEVILCLRFVDCQGVKRKIASGRADLDPGWYSAMGQGQAMSLLMRAFYRSGKF